MRSSARQGARLAVLAALCFGVTTPVVARARQATGTFTAACLLYAGAAIAGYALRLGVGERRPLRAAHTIRIVAVALAGAAIAPALLAFGLRDVGGLVGSLLLNLEAVFTVALARLVYREPIGGRVAAALGLILGGGALLLFGTATGVGWTAGGILAITFATAFWALDNVWSRPLAEHDPLAIVAAKGSIGALLTLAAALLAREPLPPLRESLALLAAGATGYGASLQLYLLAQRRIGAGRTASIFGIAPFAGAVCAIAAGQGAVNGWVLASAVLFAAGVALHATERHGHAHRHEAVEHEHAHRHDDGHHDHRHDPPVAGEHTHRHRHETVVHQHEHAPDVHHTHPH